MPPDSSISPGPLQTSDEILQHIQARARADAPAPRPIDAGQQPRTETETALAAIWAELLHLAAVGVHEDFFELGGSSLLAVQMLVCVRDRHGVDLPLHVLFASTEFTIAHLAAALDAARSGTAG